MNASRILILAVGAGLLALAAAAFAIVWKLESQVMEEALESQVRYLERHFRTVVDRIAAQELQAEGGSLESFGERLRTAAESNPAIMEMAVVSPARVLVSRFSRLGGGQIPCLARLPLRDDANHEHPAGTLTDAPLGCLLFPIYVGDTHQGSVLVHTMRDWLAEGERAGRAVKRTALRLAPVFVGFYLLLGGLLVWAGRAARRWRLRAASAERVEALGAIADGINHEIRNPLNAVSLSLQLLGRQQADEDTRKVVGEAQRQTRRIGETLEEFVRFTRVASLKTRRISLGDLAREVTVDAKGDARADVDPQKMRDAFTAMLEMLGPPRSLVLEQTRHGWRAVASGEAQGLDADGLATLFDPYVRRRPRDVGRGLALARATFQAHGGDLHAHLKGTTLTLKGVAPKARNREKG